MTDVTDKTGGAAVVLPEPRATVRERPTRPHPPVPAARPPWRRATRSAWAGAGAGVVVAVALTAVTARGLGDDSYISLDYARTLIEQGQWGLVPGRTANTATSPLNVWLLAAGLGVTGTAAGAVGLVLALAFGVVGAGAVRLARALAPAAPGPLLPLGALGLLATSPLLTSTVGLETYLGVAVVVAVAVAAVAGRPGAAGVVCGLAVLVRPDYAVPAAIVMLVLWRPARRRTWALGLVRTALAAVAVALPWHLWAWWALGGFVPDTFSFKTNPAAGRVPAMIADFDALYWSRTPVAVVVVGVVVLAGWCAAAASLRPGARAAGPAVPGRVPSGRLVVAFAASGTGHAAALMTINAYPQAWYYGPLVAGCALAVAVVVATGSRRTRVAGAACLAVYCGLALVVAGQGGVPWRAADMNSNFTDAGAYLRIGRDLPALVGDVPVAPPGEIGAITWGCRCDTVDQFSARGAARPLLDRRYERGGPLSRAVLSLNGRYRPDTPPPAPAYRLRYVRGADPTPVGVRHTWWVTSPQSGVPFRIVLVPAS